MKKLGIILLVTILGLTAFSLVTVAQDLEGSAKIDGSSTVYPVTQAMAEEFSYVHPDVRVTGFILAISRAFGEPPLNYDGGF
jgi:phosphate transport system substrate-binding protein